MESFGATNSGYTQDGYQILTNFKNMGDYRHEYGFNQFTNIIILRMHTLDDLFKKRDHTPAISSNLM